MYTKHRQKNGQISSTRCVLVMLSFLLFNGLLEFAGGKSFEEVKDKGQRVTAHWIFQNTIQQEYGTTFKDQFPERGKILVSANDLNLILEVERNWELLGQDFSETHYENGLPITQTCNHTGHCFYHGKVQGHTDSWVALSTCLGMSRKQQKIF